MRLPVLFAIYIVATAAAFGGPSAIHRFDISRREMKPVNSEPPLESSPELHPGLPEPYPSAPVCAGQDETEYYSYRDFYIGEVVDHKILIPNISARYCSIGEDGTLYLVGTSDNQYWLRAYTPSGEMKWNVPTQEIQSSLALARDGTAYLLSMPRSGNLTLTAYDRDGNARWHFDLGGFEWEPVAPVIGPDATVYVYNGVQSAPQIFALSPQGEKLWSAAAPSKVAKVAVSAEGQVLVDVPGGNLIAFNAQGEQVWKFYSPSGLQNDGLAIASDGTIYFAARFVFALDSKGKEKWTYKSDQTYTDGDYFAEDPVIAEDGTIYAATWRRRIYAITPSGRKKWVYIGNPLSLEQHLMLTATNHPRRLKPFARLRTRDGWLYVRIGVATQGWPSRNHDVRNTRSQEAP